jgi:hypothetical protein
MKRTSSVEYIAQQLQALISFDTEPARERYRQVLAEAKERHKDEVRNSYNAGIAKYFRGTEKSSEDYYNDTFE